TASPPSGGLFALGDTTVTQTAADAHGNVAAQVTFVVHVVDATAPNVTAPAAVTAEATGAVGAAVTFSASATDAVGVASLRYFERGTEAYPGATSGLGAPTTPAQAAAAAGNVGTASFTVTVRDTTAPTLSSVADQMLEATGPAGAAATYGATASDAV